MPQISFGKELQGDMENSSTLFKPLY